MNIALSYIRHGPVGGVERFLTHCARDLCERGHRVTVLCREHGAAPHPAVQFRVLRSLAFGSAGKTLAFARAVDAHLRTTRYDVVLGLGKTWSQDVLRLGGGLHRTFMQQMRGATTRVRRLDRVSLDIEQRALQAGTCRRLIANSAMVRDEVVRTYGLAPGTIDVIHNGVDLQRFSPERTADAGRALRNSLGWSEGPIFLFLGNGFRRKGLDLALAAFAAVAPGRPHARLLVVGEDGERPGFERQVREQGLAERVRFLGEREEPAACYGAADVYLLPTRYDPFANTTLEALACGLPVITTDGNGGAEVLDAESGSVVPLAGGVPSLTAAVQRWCEPRQHVTGAAAARRAAERHPIAQKMQQVEALLQRVAQERIA